MLRNPGAAPLDVYLAIERFKLPGFDGPDVEHMKIIDFVTRVAREWDTGGGGTSFGHANARGAIAVGAAAWFQTPRFGVSPPLVESFSSAGGVPILIDGAGERLPAPDLRETPGPRGTGWCQYHLLRGARRHPRGRRRVPELLRNLGGGAARGRRGGAAPGPRRGGAAPEEIERLLEAQRRRHVRAGLRPRDRHGLLDARAAFERLFRRLRSRRGEPAGKARSLKALRSVTSSRFSRRSAPRKAATDRPRPRSRSGRVSASVTSRPAAAAASARRSARLTRASAREARARRRAGRAWSCRARAPACPRRASRRSRAACRPGPRRPHSARAAARSSAAEPIRRFGFARRHRCTIRASARGVPGAARRSGRNRPRSIRRS